MVLIIIINQGLFWVNEERLFPLQFRPVQTAAEEKFLTGRVKRTDFHHYPGDC